MSAVTSQARLSAVTTETRGKAIKRRRLQYQIKSLREFAEATGVSRDAVTAAENDDASEGTYDRLEAWLDRYAEETGVDEDDPNDLPTNYVQVQVNGLFGIQEIVFKGPVSHLGEIEAAVERLVTRARMDQDPPN